MDKIILCRTAWMKYYEGRANIDIPRSGAIYILTNKTGGEIYNFKNREGKCYGYFPNIGSPALQNLEKKYTGDHIDDVTVVFCATHPIERGMRVVGWYNNATLYNTWQNNKFSTNYHAETNFKNARLIPEDDRVFELPDTFGRNSLFYFSLHPEKQKLLTELTNYIANNGELDLEKKKTKRKLHAGNAYQQDIEKRMLVEKMAIDMAVEYYGNRYGGEINVKSVQKDNKGWDLEVITKRVKLNIEVKGLSGDILNVELTPNEYQAFNKCSPNYQLFIVNNTLSNPIIRVFKYQSKGKIWVSNDKSVLKKIIKMSAILTL